MEEEKQDGILSDAGLGSVGVSCLVSEGQRGACERARRCATMQIEAIEPGWHADTLASALDFPSSPIFHHETVSPPFDDLTITTCPSRSLFMPAFLRSGLNGRL